ncbi:PD-(D/E)XK nuclease family protein [Natranaeroarchaeum aerophilus]|uniref:PD-(D/E)XK nuclease family protein n=1 Tax=Natranaeroarchaeum aerophilus TaxID=2917711 RepID=A0AAE3FRL4_9EURY|nr:PD-(D/E)XK nuclease family protein [Natranaeroarchaeum aerophilus]
MSFPLAKPVDRLYEEVAGFDLVVVPDAPLASALNRRLDRPHLGTFATTPRRLAAGRRETAEDRLAFLSVIEDADIGWKPAAHAIGDILQCWEHQGTREAILAYEEHINDVTRDVLDRVGALETTSKRLTEYRIESENVAVVGLDQLTPLERAVLPESYEVVDPFSDDAFELPPFRIFETTTAIVETVVEAAQSGAPEDIAVVLDAGSEYSPLIESALSAADVPFYGGPGFADDPDHRAFVQLLRTLHGSSNVRVGDVRPVLSRLGVDVSREHNEKRLSELDESAADLSWLRSLAAAAHEYTLVDVLAEYEDRADCSLSAFGTELGRLGLADAPATEANVDRLTFYLSTYEMPVDRENEGVLLADAKSAAYVDRPTVFFLGMDDRWTHSAPRRPWVDGAEQFTRNIQDFQLLLQSGVEQHYLVQDATGGSPVTPCLYFEELLDREYERFSDLPSVAYGRIRDEETQAMETDDGTGSFDRDRLVDGSEPTASTRLLGVDAVSQSSLGSYVNSPRDYCFDTLLSSPDREYFAEGNLFHDFAEFYVNHPDFVDESVRESVVDLLVEETRPFRRSVDEGRKRTEYRVGVDTLVAYLDDVSPEDTAFLSPSDGWGTNAVAEHFDRSIDSPVTERWFEDEELGVRGKIDLVADPTHLVDFKSGSKKGATAVVGNAAIDPPSDTPDFQALLYLTYWRSQYPDRQLSFTFVHFLELLDEIVTGELALEDLDVEDGELDDALTTITYYPKHFSEYASSRSTFEALRDEGAKKCQKTLSQVEYRDYAAVFEQVPIHHTTDSDELIESAFGESFIDRMQAIVGEYKYVVAGCKQAMRELTRIRDRNYFEGDLDAFETFLDDQLAELNRRHTGEERFPVGGPGEEPNERYLNHRDLLLEGER